MIDMEKQEFDDLIEQVTEKMHRMSAEVVLTGRCVLTVRYCMVCGEHADEAFAIMDPFLHYKWEPCGHKLELT